MLHHFYSHLIADQVDRRYQQWISAGQELGSIPTETGCVLTYSRRYRLGLIPTLVVFGGMCALAAWLDLFVEPLGFWLRIAYGGIFFPLFLVLLYLSIKAWTTRITLTREGIVFRHFGIDSLPVAWESIAVVHRSHWTPSIILTTFNDERYAVSLELDGLEAFVQFFVLLKSAVFRKSAVDWFIDFDSKLAEQGISTWIVLQDQPCADESHAANSPS
jgi:hypothetical protein